VAGLKRLSTRQGTRPGIRLWTVKQAPFLQGGVPTWDFDPSDITFTPNLARRTDPGPFAGAPILQGKFDGSGVPDVLGFSKGSQISGNFYANSDTNQGSIVFWYTPEKDRDVTAENRMFLFFNTSTYIRYENDDNRFRLECNGQTSFKTFTPVAGTLYHIVFRWDANNTLDGTNHFCLSINDSHEFAMASMSPQANAATLYLGSYNGTSRPSNSIEEGFTIYRRPLFDGTYGIDAGNGDEINLMWAAGVGKDPCLITGSWDICFCLPTLYGQSTLSTSSGHAWSHPHSSNLLGAGGFMMDGTYTNDGWADEGTPTAVAALAAAEKIFPGGYKATSDAANEGIYKDYTCSAGDNFAIRAIGHSDGTSVPKAILYDQDNAAEIGSLTGSNASTRTAPDIFIFTGQAPAGCTTLRVKLINTDATASDITYWHQCELLVNKVTNPSMEGGAGDPWIPTGWGGGADAGEISEDLVNFHSGLSSAKFAGGLDSDESLKSSTTPTGGYVSQGVWAYGAGTLMDWLYNDSRRLHSSEGVGPNQTITPGLTWALMQWVIRCYGSYGRMYLRNSDGDVADTISMDDAFSIPLTSVTITIAAANETNSQEENGIRIDGGDTGTKDITGKLGAKAGKVRFKWIPRHGYNNFENFGANDPGIIRIHYDSDNSVKLYHKSDTRIRLDLNVAGAGIEDDFWSGSTIVAGTTYLIEVEYTSTQCIVSFDGVVKITITYTGGINFGANIPNTVTLGKDAVFLAP